MYEVTYTVDGVQRKMEVNASDAIVAQNIITNMFGIGNVQIINVRRI